VNAKEAPCNKLPIWPTEVLIKKNDFYCLFKAFES